MSSNFNKIHLIGQLYQAGAFKFGEFHLKSGQMTPIYIDLRSLISKPALFKTAVNALWNEISTKIGPKIGSEFLICGVPQAAVPLATGLLTLHNTPMLLKRKEPKGYGTKKLIEGDFQPGQQCLLIEDVVTLGQSIRETAEAMRKEGLKINHALTLVDRQQGARENLQSAGIILHCVLTLDEILAYLNSQGDLDDGKVLEIKNQLSDTSYLKNGN